MSDFEERKARFIEALTRLSNEHGMHIHSCECCGGWDVYESEANERRGSYRPGNHKAYAWTPVPTPSGREEP